MCVCVVCMRAFNVGLSKRNWTQPTASTMTEYQPFEASARPHQILIWNNVCRGALYNAK